jgi:hypothetical protein
MVGPGIKIDTDTGVLGLKFPDAGREDPGIPLILPPLGKHQNPVSFPWDWDAPAGLPKEYGQREKENRRASVKKQAIQAEKRRVFL